MAKRLGVVREWGSALAALFGVVSFSASAFAQDVWTPSEEDLSAIGSSGNALTALRTELETGPINLCGFASGYTSRDELAVSATGNAVTLRCSGLDAPVVFGYSQRAMFGLDNYMRQDRLMMCETRDGGAFYVPAGQNSNNLSCINSAGRHGYFDRERLRRFVTAWTYLSRNASWQAPDEATLRTFLQAPPAITAETQESLRRAQVQAEVAIREQRLIDASEIYYHALVTTPNWADGHFNRALLLGELEFFAAAVYHMRSYLILLPDAADARAAQDKIYEWEARLQRPPPP